MASVEFRGTKVELEELADIRAVRVLTPQVEARAVNVASQLRENARAITDQILSEPELAEFQRAGFVFARASESLASAARVLSDGPIERVVHRVFRTNEGQLYVETPRLLVKFKSNIKLDSLRTELSKVDLRIVRALKFAGNLFEVTCDSGRGLEAKWPKSAMVEYVEPEFLQQIYGRMRPTDPSYALQWQWHNDGSSGGVAGADLRAEAAWIRTLGRGVRVAVIDNGMDVEHEDLQAGIAGGGHFQDDGSGSGPFVPLSAGSGFPGGNHGTFCLGLVGARANNSRGGCGAAPESSLIPIACLTDQIGSQATLARAVAYAADPTTEDASASAEQGADVISCSLGPNGANWVMESVLQDAIDFATSQGRGGKGTPLFWAVSNGNFAVKHDEVCSYASTIAVGRSSRMDLEDGSAFGPELDFLAPGVEVYSTRQGNRYGFSTGTSYATPCAAGVAALVLAMEPQLSGQELRDRLRATCDKIGPLPYQGTAFGGRNDTYGFGRINAELALGGASSPSGPSSSGVAARGAAGRAKSGKKIARSSAKTKGRKQA